MMLEKMLNLGVKSFSSTCNTGDKLSDISLGIVAVLIMTVPLTLIYLWCLVLLISAAIVYKFSVKEMYELTDEQRIWCKENKIKAIDLSQIIQLNLRVPEFCTDYGIVKFKREDEAMAFRLRWE